MTRKLRVFLCHASQDKPAVRELYQRLAAESWIEPWLDEENLLPGQDFDLEIYKAARDADAIIICLSKVSVAKEGYVNKEIRRALDAADEKPEGAIYIIPLRLDDCSPSFERLKKLHYADYFTTNAHERLLKSLRLRADTLKIETVETKVEFIPKKTPFVQALQFDLYKFIQIPSTTKVPYSFHIGKYPVTNRLYSRFLDAPDFSDQTLWCDFLKFDEKDSQIGKWENEGWAWFLENSKGSARIEPENWNDPEFGISRPENPVVGVNWYEANAYCNWLLRHWNEVSESKANFELHPSIIRLSLDSEWTTAAGGDEPYGRYPWDIPGSITSNINEIVVCANIEKSHIGHTTPVNNYYRGASTYGVMDMVGNVWEWQANYRYNYHYKNKYLSARGGAYYADDEYTFMNKNYTDDLPENRSDHTGFRVVVLPGG